MYKFESKFNLDDVTCTVFGDELVKIVTVCFSEDGIYYNCRRTDGVVIPFKESELDNISDEEREAAKHEQ